MSEVNPLGAGSGGAEKGAGSGRDYWGLQEAAMDHPRYRSLAASITGTAVSVSIRQVQSWETPIAN